MAVIARYSSTEPAPKAESPPGTTHTRFVCDDGKVIDTANPVAGVYGGLPFEDYVTLPFVNSSSLKHMAHSPRRFNRMRQEPETPSSEDQNIGKGVHCMVLEPDRFASLVIPPPKKKDGTYYVTTTSQAWTEYAEANRGKIILTDEQRDTVYKVAQRIKDDPFTGDYLKLPLRGEETFIWKCPITGLWCKGRNDVRIFGKFRLDMKVMASAGKAEFQTACTKWGYWAQDAFYELGATTLGLPEVNMAFLVAEKDGDMDVCIYEPDSATKVAARQQVREWLENLKRCVEKDWWPGVSEWEQRDIPVGIRHGIIQIGAPMWWLRQFSDGEEMA